jgi:hypothetical protein
MVFLYNKIPLSDPLKATFAYKVMTIAEELDTDPDYLMAVMYFESKLHADAKNPYGSATGLIQFTSKTARSLGTTTKELAVMDSVSQLEYVKKYLMPYRGKLTSLVNVYLAVFQPSAIRKPDEYVLSLSYKWVEANKIFDLDRNGKIVKSEIAAYLTNYFKKLGWNK